MENKLLLSPLAAAQTMSISRSLLYELMQAGDINSIKVQRARRIPTSEIERYIASQIEAQRGGHQKRAFSSPEQNGGAK